MGQTGAYARASRGFMGKEWDGGDIAFRPETWRAVFDLMKPGAHLLSFAGTRTMDVMGLALRLAGLEVRDCLSWNYGSGFPKSLDISKAIDKEAGAIREVVGRATGRAATPKHDIRGGRYADGTSRTIDLSAITAPATDAARQWEGWGTALKPAWEPILMARKPLIGTVAANVQAHGTGGINVDACRIGTSDSLNGGAYSGERRAHSSASVSLDRGGIGEYAQPSGRWPSNVVLDEEAAAELDAQTGESTSRIGKPRAGASGDGWGMTKTGAEYADSGGASRFFYTAKASSAERELEDGSRSTHPTVKPTDLMRWLVRLVTPPGGVVLDPFMGSGSTGVACAEEGFRFIGIEREPEYHAIAVKRLDAATRQGRLAL